MSLGISHQHYLNHHPENLLRKVREDYFIQMGLELENLWHIKS